MMNIASIYKQYPVTKLLQEHQIRAAAVGAYISDKWLANSEINKNVVIQSLLLHDMGNIIKFDFDNPILLTEDEKKNITFWKKEQENLKDKYGEEHMATHGIAKELGVSEQVYNVLLQIGSSQLPKTLTSDNWELKVVSYSDLRCGPQRVVSIDERFDDIIQRYKNSNHPLGNVEEVNGRRKLALELEKQLQDKVDIDIKVITNETINLYITTLLEYSF